MDTVILTRSDLEALVSLDAGIAAIDDAFRRFATGGVRTPAPMALHVADGGFHVKAAHLHGTPSYFAAKLNANFPANPRTRGLPTVQGVLTLVDAITGAPLAVMDSIGVTVLRTGAATAVAARALARADAGTLLIAGCGEQGRISVRMLGRVRRLRRILLWDIERARAEQLAGDLRADADGRAEIVVVDALRPASLTAELIVTGTPSRVPFLEREDVAPGTFIAAVGADSPEKQELDAALLAASAVVPDVLSQALVMGDLHHAVEGGVMTADDIRGELGDVLVGARPGRQSEEDVIVFDSTGAGLQDVALAAVAYERAIATGIGLRLDLSR